MGQPQQGHGGEGRSEGAPPDQGSGLEPVGQPQRGADQGSGDKSQLHRRGEPWHRSSGDMPLARERTSDRGCAKPDTEREQFRQGYPKQGKPLGYAMPTRL